MSSQHRSPLFISSDLQSGIQPGNLTFCRRKAVCDNPRKMSPTDAKRGAKRRKSKRGGGSSSCTSTICSIASNIQAGSSTTARTPLSTAPAAPVTSFLTPGSTGNGDVGGIPSLNGEVRVVCRCASVMIKFYIRALGHCGLLGSLYLAS